MKKAVKMLMIVVILCVFSLKTHAEEPEDFINEFKESVPEEYEDILLDFEGSAVGIDRVIDEIKGLITKSSTAVFGFFLSLIGCIALMSAARLCPEKSREDAERGVAIISAVFVGGALVKLFVDTSEALASVSSFFSSLIPVMTAVTLAGGGVKTAEVSSMGMNMVLSLLGGAFSAVLSCLCGFSVAMGLSASVGGSGAVNLSRSSKNLFLAVFGIAGALLMGVLSLQTVVSSASDSAAMRMAKYTAQSSIPMVGSLVSASLSTLASGLAYAKGIIGAGAIFVILLMLLSPLLMLLFYRLALSVSASLGEMLGIKAAADCFSSFRGSLDLTIGLYGLSGILYVFQIILFIKSGVAAL